MSGKLKVKGNSQSRSIHFSPSSNPRHSRKITTSDCPTDPLGVLSPPVMLATKLDTVLKGAQAKL